MRNRSFLALLWGLLVVLLCVGGLVAGALLTARIPALAALLSNPQIEPTVVAIPTTRPAPAPLANGSNPEQQLIQLYQVASPAVVNITTQVLRPSFFWGAVPESGSGSGFVWDEQGHILTNSHVIEGAQSIEVSFGEDTVLTARVVGADPQNDLAVLRVETLPAGVTPLLLGDSDALQVGQTAVVIGNPFGQFQRTLTTGVISALNRTIETDDSKVMRGVIQTDAAINRGNSGGPLLDSSGRVIGITSAIYSPSGTSAGVGLAIPINKAKRVAPVLIQEGRFRHPWLGIEQLGYAITPSLTRALDLPVTQGLLIGQMYRGSPAAQAGVQAATREVIVGNRRLLAGGDILTAIDGVPLATWEDLDAYLQERTEVGQTVTLTLLRDGQPLPLQVVIGEEPNQ